jgi:hypothetical protein
MGIGAWTSPNSIVGVSSRAVEGSARRYQSALVAPAGARPWDQRDAGQASTGAGSAVARRDGPRTTGHPSAARRHRGPPPRTAAAAGRLRRRGTSTRDRKQLAGPADVDDAVDLAAEGASSSIIAARCSGRAGRTAASAGRTRPDRGRSRARSSPGPDDAPISKSASKRTSSSSTGSAWPGNERLRPGRSHGSDEHSRRPSRRPDGS